MSRKNKGGFFSASLRALSSPLYKERGFAIEQRQCLQIRLHCFFQRLLFVTRNDETEPAVGRVDADDDVGGDLVWVADDAAFKEGIDGADLEVGGFFVLEIALVGALFFQGEAEGGGHAVRAGRRVFL